MQTASIAQLKKELKQLSPQEISELCLSLAKFKKENKELLSYLVFEKANELHFIQQAKDECDQWFNELNTSSFFYMKKGIRKILRQLKKYIRFSKQKLTEVELLLHFCEQLNKQEPNIFDNNVLSNMYFKQAELAKKAFLKLHEDLQYDFKKRIESL